MELYLPTTFIWDFSISRDACAVLEGRVYVISKRKLEFDGPNYLCQGSQRFELSESEEVAVLEQQFFTSNETKLEEYMSVVIEKNFIKKVHKSSEEIQRLANIYSSLKDTSIERFIMIDVFDEYNYKCRSTSNELDIDTNKWDSLPDLECFPSIRDLFSRDNTLDTLLQNKGLLIEGNKCFSLSEYHIPKDQTYVMFKGRILKMEYWCMSRDLDANYRAMLVQRIHAKALEHGSMYTNTIKEQQDVIANINCQIKRKSEAFEGRASARRGEIEFQKLGLNLYRVLINIAPFIMEKKGKYYHFPSAQIGTELQVSHDSLKINGPARVLFPPYYHPFVYNDGKICYAGNERWARHKIVFEKWYELRKPKILARKIATVLREGKNVIEAGYIGATLKPVMTLEEHFSPIAYTKLEAVSYANNHSISMERIMRQDE